MTMPRNLWEAILEIQAGRAYFNYELNRYVFAAEFEEKPDTRNPLETAVAAVHDRLTRAEQMRTSPENVRDALLALHRLEVQAYRSAITPPR